MKLFAKTYPGNTTRKLIWLEKLASLGGEEGVALVASLVAFGFIGSRLWKLSRDADAFQQTRASALFRVRVAATANASLSNAFEIIVPIDVTTIMPGYGPLPAVVGIENQTGHWDTIGQTRIVRLADSTTAREEITLYEAPTRFDYQISDWSGALKLLAREAKSEWHFREIAPDQTQITWNYAFAPRSVWTAWLLLAAVQGLWRGAMKRALHECVRQAENSGDFSV